MIVNIPVSLGELIDKISILHIKKSKIKNKMKKKLVVDELKLLKKILKEIFADQKNITNYLDRLIITNKKLWKIEDDIRQYEKQKKFNRAFIELARSVYVINDERSKIKLEINKKFGSKIVEVKSYKDY